MPSALHAVPLADLARTADTLLSPLRWPTRRSWVDEVLRTTRDLFKADASIAYGPLIPDGAASPDLSASLLARFRELMVYPEGRMRSRDPVIDQAYLHHRANLSRIVTMRHLREAAGPRLEDGELWQTVIGPSGLLGSVAIAVTDGGTDTTLSVMTRGPEQLDPADDARAALHLLRSSLAAGLEVLRRLDHWRAGLESLLDEVETGLAVYAVGGTRELARNRVLRRLLSEEPERERLMQGVLEAARTRQHRELTLRSTTYRFVATFLSPGVFDRSGVVLVLVDRAAVRLPPVAQVVGRFGVTRRQAQIALLAAEGLSNQAIGERLGVSHHTVRHHLEQVFDRLGVNTRRSMALRLLRVEHLEVLP